MPRDRTASLINAYKHVLCPRAMICPSLRARFHPPARSRRTIGTLGAGRSGLSGVESGVIDRSVSGRANPEQDRSIASGKISGFGCARYTSRRFALGRDERLPRTMDVFGGVISEHRQVSAEDRGDVPGQAACRSPAFCQKMGSIPRHIRSPSWVTDRWAQPITRRLAGPLGNRVGPQSCANHGSRPRCCPETILGIPCKSRHTSTNPETASDH